MWDQDPRFHPLQFANTAFISLFYKAGDAPCTHLNLCLWTDTDCLHFESLPSNICEHNFYLFNKKLVDTTVCQALGSVIARKTDFSQHEDHIQEKRQMANEQRATDLQHSSIQWHKVEREIESGWRLNILFRKNTHWRSHFQKHKNYESDLGVNIF